jgi:type II secretory pathway predicted ATPase ExeA
MDGQQGLDRATRPRTESESSNSHRVVSSRRCALERLRIAVECGISGPVLVTGEPGAGKTWLIRRLAEALPSGWRSASVDLASAMDALDFLRLIGHSLGASIPNRLGEARLMLQSTLQDESADGRSWLLIVDEAHRGTAEVWDEIHAIRNQLGQPNGFAAVILLGHTELRRALATRRYSGLATTLQAKLHLMPIDVDEARELLSDLLRDGNADEEFLEELHRDSGGNPALLFHLASLSPPFLRPGPKRSSSHRDPIELPAETSRLLSTPVKFSSSAAPRPDATADSSALPNGHGRVNAPSLLPARPPIRLEDGLVEVGWEGDLDLDATEIEGADTVPESSPPCPDDSSFNEELVEDRYAALQAWTEWTRNQERVVSGTAADTVAEVESMAADEDECVEIPDGPPPTFQPEPTAADSSVPTAIANIRAEPQHEFAPYSQLFTRLKQSR